MRLGWTRGGSPGIFGWSGGYGRSPEPLFSSRADHSSSGVMSCATSSIDACGSPISANRFGMVRRSKSSGSTSVSSSQVTGVETVARAFARSE
jgi:hypothetical protein